MSSSVSRCSMTPPCPRRPGGPYASTRAAPCSESWRSSESVVLSGVRPSPWCSRVAGAPPSDRWDSRNLGLGRTGGTRRDVWDSDDRWDSVDCGRWSGCSSPCGRRRTSSMRSAASTSARTSGRCDRSGCTSRCDSSATPILRRWPQRSAPSNCPPPTARVGGPLGLLGRDAVVVPVDGLDALAAAVADATGGPSRRFVGHLTLGRHAPAHAGRTATCRCGRSSSAGSTWCAARTVRPAPASRSTRRCTPGRRPRRDGCDVTTAT